MHVINVVQQEKVKDTYDSQGVKLLTYKHKSSIKYY